MHVVDRGSTPLLIVYRWMNETALLRKNKQNGGDRFIAAVIFCLAFILLSLSFKMFAFLFLTKEKVCKKTFVFIRKCGNIM